MKSLSKKALQKEVERTGIETGDLRLANPSGPQTAPDPDRPNPHG
jgi:hypothetical protein